MDAIGNAPLRENAISRAGTILGLQKDMVYDIDAYVGTVYKELQLTADSRALLSMEGDAVMDYEYLRSEVIRIQIPDTFNNGYYFVNGKGLFRYVKGDKYTDETDFNLTNHPEEDSPAKQQGTSEVDAATDESHVIIYKPGTYQITISYNDDLDVEETSEVPEPSASILIEDGILPFVALDHGILSLTVDLDEGVYQLVFDDLYGRTCTILAEREIANTQDAAAQEEEAAGAEGEGA